MNTKPKVKGEGDRAQFGIHNGYSFACDSSGNRRTFESKEQAQRFVAQNPDLRVWPKLKIKALA